MQTRKYGGESGGLFTRRRLSLVALATGLHLAPTLTQAQQTETSEVVVPDPVPAGADDSIAPAGAAAASEPTATDGSAAAGEDIEEIVVTGARLRVESAVDVPASITVLSQEDIARYATDDLQGIADQTPGVVVARAGVGSGGSIGIRGISSSPLSVSFEQTVATNIDGVLLSRGRVAFQSFFDLQSVEVLKGPQALYFGKNSPAGVISLKSADPTSTWQASGSTGYEFVADETSGQAIISGPVSETLGVRVAVSARDMKGWLYNDARAVANPASVSPDTAIFTGGATDRIGESETVERITLQYLPSDAFSATLKALATQYQDDGAAPSAGTQIIGCTSPDQPSNAYIGGDAPLADPTAGCTADNHTAFGRAPAPYLTNWALGAAHGGAGYSDASSSLVSLTMNWSYELGKVTSITGYYESDSEYAGTGIGSTYPFSYLAQTDKSSQISQELRYLSTLPGQLNFLVGGYAQQTDLTHDFDAILAEFGPDPDTGTWASFFKDGETEGKAISAFGQVVWNIRDNLELAAGARWSREEKKSLTQMPYVHKFFQGTFGQQRLKDTFKGNNTSPELTLTWHPEEGQTVYGAYKTGYKSGGFSLDGLQSPTTEAAAYAYRPEKVSGFEGGYKAELMDRRLNLSVGAFYYEYKDLQVQTFDPTTIELIVTNAASLIQKGIEMQGRYNLTRALQLRADVTYQNVKYKDYETAPCYSTQTVELGCVDGVQDLSGRPTVQAPELVGNVGASFMMPVLDMSLDFSSDLNYSDSYYAALTAIPTSLQDSFFKLNAGARLIGPDERWELALIGRSLTDEYVLNESHDKFLGSGEQIATVSRGREIMLRTKIVFK